MIWRNTRQIIEFFLIAALAFGLLTGAFAWRLAQGPININYLKGHIEAALNNIGIPFKIEIERTHIAWAGWERPLDLRISGLRIINDQNFILAQIDETSVGFKISTLVKGAFVPRSLEILRPEINLVRRKNGKLLLSMGSENNIFSDNFDLFQKFIAWLRSSGDTKRPVGLLRNVSVVDAEVILEDRATNNEWIARKTRFVLKTLENSQNASFSTDLKMGDHWVSLSGSAKLPFGQDKIEVKTELDNFRPNLLAESFKSLKVMKHILIPLKGTVVTTFLPEGLLEKVNFSLASSAGLLSFEKHWSAPVELSSVNVSGTVNFLLKTANVKKAFTDSSGTIVKITTEGNFRGESTILNSEVQVKDISAKKFQSLWPKTIATGGRKWLQTNLSSGKIVSGQVVLQISINGDLEKVEVGKLVGSARIKGISMKYLGKMPKVSNIHGSVEFNKKQIIFSLIGGQSNGLSVKAGQVELANLNDHRNVAKIDLVVLGSIETKLRMFRKSQLGSTNYFDIPSRKVKGQANTRIKMTVPLISGVSLEDVELRIQSKTRDVFIPDLVPGKDLTNGNFNLDIDNDGLLLIGEAKVLGAPLQFRWREAFNNKRKQVRRIEIKGALEQTQWEQFGFKKFASRLSGPIDIDLALLQLPGTKKVEIIAKLQLQRATIKLAEFGWVKKPGKVALGWVTALVSDDGSINLRNFNLAAAGLKFSGRGLFGPNGDFLQLEIKKFTLNKTEVGIMISPNMENAGLNIKIKGKAFDLTYLLKRSIDTPYLQYRSPLFIKFNIDTVWIWPGKELKRVRGEILADSTSWRSANVTSYLPFGDQLQIDFETTQSAHTLRISSKNAGAFIRYLDLSRGVKKGVLNISLQKSLEHPHHGWAGLFEVTRFSLVDAPVLARMLSLASFSGILNTLTGEGVSFRRLHTPFRLQNDALRIANARAVGSELGITAEGKYDLERDLLDIKGTIVPAYTINSVLGNLPILGGILTGKKGSGVIAVNYRVVGERSDPGIQVNPLSALAPGFLRNLIGIFGADRKKRQEKIILTPPKTP